MSEHIYYNFSINNDTVSNLICDKTDRRLSALIQNPSDYALSILKFSLPTEAIKSFNVNNLNDYKIIIGNCSTIYVINDNNNFRTFEGSNSLPLSSSYNYVNTEDVIEAINRTLLATYRDYLGSFSSGSPSFQNRLVYNNTYNFTVNTSPWVHEQSISINPVINTVDNILGYIKLTLNIGYVGSPIIFKQPHRLYLVDPSGTKCLIYANFEGNYNNTLIFEDANLTSLESIQDYETAIPSGSYQPKESFLKFNKSTSQFGTWKIRLESTNGNLIGGVDTFRLSVNYNLEMFFCPKQKDNSLSAVNFPPVLGLDETDRTLLQLKLHESWFYSNNYLKLTPKLANILSFPTYLSSDGNYKVKMPQVLLSPTLSSNTFINYTQPLSTLYKLTNIKAIQIRSNTLPVSGEYSIVSQSNIVMSIDVPPDSQKDIYAFSASLERFYDIIGNIEMADINFSVWVEYNDGTVSQAYLPPYSSFTMLCKFVLKEKTVN